MQQNEQEQSGPREESGLPVVDGEEQIIVVSDEQEQQLLEAQAQAKEYLDLLQRSQADFFNYRRRVNQEQAETRLSAQIGLLNQFLPVLDDLERAVTMTPPDLAQNSWVQGLFLIARRLTVLLEQLGVRRIGTSGERFDPRLHEAIGIEANTDEPEGAIVRVVRTGYTLGERVVRPAQVIVAGAPSPVSGAS